MLKSQNSLSYLYSKLRREYAKDFWLPLVFALIVQCISHLQFIGVVFASMFPENPSSTYKIILHLKDFTLVTGIFSYFNVFSHNTLCYVIWWVLIGYFVKNLCLLFCLRNKETLRWLSGFMCTLLLFHSRMLFFLIHVYLLQFIEKYKIVNLKKVIVLIVIWRYSEGLSCFLLSMPLKPQLRTYVIKSVRIKVLLVVN